MAITTLVFDAYGTLFDVTAAARAAAQEPQFPALSGRWQALAADWRDRQLHYSWLRAITGEHADFWSVTCDALDWALEAQGLGDDPALRDRLRALYRALSAYEEVPALLAAAKQAGYQTAILSNGSPEMLEDAVASAGLGDHLDALLSVEQAGIFKPAAPTYDLVRQRFGTNPNQVLFVSANGWDAAAAKTHGFHSAWVNRTGQPVERLPGRPDLTLPDLSGLLAAAQMVDHNLSTSAAEIGQTAYFKTEDGLRLAYRDDGRRDGPVLLCLAGLTRNLADFDFVARDFADQARILRLDTRGRGQSDWDSNYLNYSLSGESRDAIALLDHLGIERAAILGTSRGGLIAMALAGTHPDRLSGVCFNDIGPEIDPAGLAFIASYLGSRPQAANYEEAADGFAQFTAERFPGVPRDRWRLHAERLYIETPDGLNLRYDARLRKSILEQSATDAIPDVWQLFVALKDRPLALIRGEHSDILPDSTAQEMRRRRPDMIFGQVPDCGHVPFLDEPVARDVITRFLASLP